MSKLLIFSLVLLNIMACNNSQNESATESTTEQNTTVVEEPNHTNTDYSTAIVSEQKVLKTAFESGEWSYYTVQDGEGLIAESTTYFQDEAKTQPAMTKLIYLTGDFVNVFWLSNEVVWMDKDDYTYIFQEGAYWFSLQEGTMVESNSIDIEKATAVLEIANGLLNTK